MVILQTAEAGLTPVHCTGQTLAPGLYYLLYSDPAHLLNVPLPEGLTALGVGCAVVLAEVAAVVGGWSCLVFGAVVGGWRLWLAGGAVFGG